MNALEHAAQDPSLDDSPPRKSTILAAWIILLVASALPRIILQEIFHQPVSSTLQAAISAGVVSIGLLLSLVWEPLHALRAFLIVFLVLVGAEWLVFTWLDQLPTYRSWLGNPSFNVYMLAEQSLRLMVTLVMIAALFLLRGRREAFFLVKGDTSAPVEPVRWLGAKPGDKWDKFGRAFALYLSLGTLAFLVIAGRPSLDLVARALPFLPAVLVAAALNAFNEEMTYKASFLSVLEGPLGKRQALWLMAALFGIGHFYGVPYGIVGVLMATFLGWLLGKSMLETRGLLWAWFLHFLQDVLIFAFLAVGSITAGGA
jgi:hypothetical protein